MTETSDARANAKRAIIFAVNVHPDFATLRGQDVRLLLRSVDRLTEDQVGKLIKHRSFPNGMLESYLEDTQHVEGS